MTEFSKYDELAKKAGQGNKEAMLSLSEAIYEPLRNYVFRITLSDDLADDIVQETILEMYKIFGQLRNGDRFWPWLCKIALNKIRLHSRTRTRQNVLLQQHAEELTQRHGDLEGLANIINDEIKQTIFQAILNLNEHQKAVLTMRCYEDMSYPQIAQIMGMSELGVRLLFFRAKKNLQNYLSNSGLGKKSLIMALVLFGKMTASSEAAAAKVCVSSSALGVGTTAAILGTVTTKTALVLTTCGLVTLGVVAHGPFQDSSGQSLTAGQQSAVLTDQNQKSSAYTNLEGYYYYPLGSDGPFMMRLSMSGKDKTCQALQNDTGNYLIENANSNVVIRNARCWNPDLSVMITPTDSPQLESFIAAIENRRPIEHKSFLTPRALLIAATRSENKDNISFTIQNYDALMEERFQYNWTAQSTVLEQRDAMHRQGWCYFTMTGSFKDRRISGLGQIPFLYGTSRTKPAWLALNIGDQIELYDSAQGAVRKDKNGATAYRQNALFAGLNKPWMGFHCMDSVRRDAALCNIPFQTELLAGAAKSKVTLKLARGTIQYLLDMNQDWIEQITFQDTSGNPCGQILFAYSEKLPAGHTTISFPVASQDSESSSGDPVNWLAQLASGEL